MGRLRARARTRRSGWTSPQGKLTVSSASLALSPLINRLGSLSCNPDHALHKTSRLLRRHSSIGSRTKRAATEVNSRAQGVQVLPSPVSKAVTAALCRRDNQSQRNRHGWLTEASEADGEREGLGALAVAEGESGVAGNGVGGCSSKQLREEEFLPAAEEDDLWPEPRTKRVKFAKPLIQPPSGPTWSTNVDHPGPAIRLHPDHNIFRPARSPVPPPTPELTPPRPPPAQESLSSHAVTRANLLSSTPAVLGVLSGADGLELVWFFRMVAEGWTGRRWW